MANKKLYKKGSFIEPSKELSFGGPKKYQTGSYPVYNKDSKEAASFREAFARAGRTGQKTFEWEGRKYNTRLAGESDAAYNARMEKNSKNSAPEPAVKGKVASPIARPETPKPTLATGPRPSLSAPASKSKSEERKENRADKKAEQTAKKNTPAPTADKKTTAPAAPKSKGLAGIRTSNAGESSSNTVARKTSGMSMGDIGGKEVNMSAMKSSSPAPSAPSAPASKKVDKLKERAARARAKQESKSDKQEARTTKRAAINAAKEDLKNARRGMKTGGLKDVKPTQKGLAKLPTAVRNKMGYKKMGGKY